MATDRENISSVVKKSLCLQCGTCVSICPENCIVFERDKMQNYVPVVDEQLCVKCGLCLEVCPGVGVDFKILSNDSDLGKKRKYHPYIGKYLTAFLGYSMEERIRAEASSGGVVPTILLHLLKTGAIDGAIVVRNKEKSPFNPEVFIAKSQQEIFDSVQSKYHPVCLNTALKEIYKDNGKYALVGLPCHIQGLRKYERLKKLDGKIFLTIGLFCGLNLRFDSLEFFAYKAGENVGNLKKVLYREGKWPGRMVLEFSGAKKCTINKNIINHIFTLPRCLFCIDHTSELADISCGDAWLPEVLNKDDDGWSAIISRSFRGQEILDELSGRNELFLEKVNVDKVIESQYSMLCFKKKNSWLRLKLSKILGKDTPKYNTESLSRNLNLPYLIGNTILIFVVHLMKNNRIKNLVKNIPLGILEFYKVLILKLLYRDKFLRRIGKKVVNNFSEIPKIRIIKIFNIYKKYKEKYGVGVIVLFPSVLLYKIIRKIFFYTRDIFEYGIYTFIENKDYDINYLKKVTGSKNENDLSKKIKVKRKFLTNWDGISTVEQYNEFFPGGMKKKIDQAKTVCEHIFDLLGSGPRKLSSEGDNYQPIDWHLDFKSGHRWNSKLFFRWIKHGSIEGADIIVPWEQSRFQSRMALAQAYKLTDDPKLAVEFQDQVNDWIENNRFGFGVNWRCAMDTAIRAANWLVIKELFETSFNFPEAFLIKLYGSLYDHGRYIRKHLQCINNVTTNHYIAGIVGLLFIALYCPFFKRSKEWQNFAVRELEKEIRKQVYPDGCDYEASTSYHLLALEMFFYALLLCERAGIFLSESYKSKINKMFKCVLYYIKPTGMAPQIGDNDNGRFFKFSNRPILEHKYLLSLAASYFKDGNFKLKQLNLEEEPFWIFGKNTKTLWDNLPLGEGLLETKSFLHAGWHIIRHNNDYCFISCGPNGQGGRGGHAHNDKLSFELAIDGQDIIVDPGTYVYTPYPEERNKFRSTEYHNTIKFNGYEQNEILKDAIFGLLDRVKIKEATLEKTKNEIRFEGEIQYLDFTHKRIIILNKELRDWQIVDNIFCSKPTKAKLIFHLSPNLFYNEGFIFSKKTHKRIVLIEAEDYEIKKEEYDYSLEYGLKTKAECLIASIPAMRGSRTVTTYIRKIK